MPSATKEKTIELSDFFARRVRTVAIQIGDETDDTFWIKYKPDALTRKLQAEIEATEEEDKTATLLAELIVSWSFTKDGEPYPVTADNIEALGLPAMMTIYNFTWDDFNKHALGKPTSTASPPDSNGS